MAKPIKTIIKLQIPAGKATPAPPIGPTLGQHGLNIQDFCNRFNKETNNKSGQIIPVEITVYEDNSFDFILKNPPVSEFLKKAADVEKGSEEPNKKRVGKVTPKQIEEIAKKKMPDLNTSNLEQAKRVIEGTARSMGIKVESQIAKVKSKR